jgi:hypothetical protein
LDDLGLSAAAFRVYCRIVRRAGEGGVCFESLPKIAKAVRLWRPAVTRALQELEARGLVRVVDRPGRSSEIAPTPAERWRPNQGGKHTRSGFSPGAGRKTAPVPGRKSARVPGLDPADEGTPPKVLPQGSPLRETEERTRVLAVWAARDAQGPTLKDLQRHGPALLNAWEYDRRQRADDPPTLRAWLVSAKGAHPDVAEAFAAQVEAV